jgi:cytochrome c-type biogenesis protein CcmH/NrfG
VNRRRVRSRLLLRLAVALHVATAKADFCEDDVDLAAHDQDYAAAVRAADDRNWTEASRRLVIAERRHPEHFALQALLGSSYVHLQRPDLALVHYQRALQLDPRNRGAHRAVGQIHLQAGNVAGAERHMDALRTICLLPCQELKLLQDAIADAKVGR